MAKRVTPTKAPSARKAPALDMDRLILDFRDQPDRVIAALRRDPALVPKVVAYFGVTATRLVQACAAEDPLRVDVALVIAQSKDQSYYTLFGLKQALSPAERTALLARIESKGLRQKLIFLGFDEPNAFRDQKSFVPLRLPPGPTQYGSKALESWVQKNELGPRLSAVISGLAGQLAHETGTIQKFLATLDGQGLEALRRYIERNLSSEAHQKLVDRQPFKGKATIEKLLRLFSGEPFGAPAPLSFALLAQAGDAFAKIELPDGERKADWLERGARCPVIGALVGWVHDGFQVASALSNAQLEALFPQGGIILQETHAWSLIGRNDPAGYTSLTAFIERHDAAHLSTLISAIAAVVPALIPQATFGEILKRRGLESVALGISLLKEDELGARCLAARRGGALASVLDTGLDAQALKAAATAAKRALGMELLALELPAKLPPEDPFPGAAVAPKNEMPGLYDYPEGWTIYRSQGVLFEQLDSLLSYLSFLAPKELTPAERATRTRALIAEKGYAGIAEHQLHGTTGYSVYGNRLFMACSEAFEHAAAYDNRGFTLTGATVKMIARIRPDPKCDPVFSSGRLTPDHPLINDECALFGRPAPDRVDWFMDAGEGRYFPVLDQARLKTAVERLGGLTSTLFDFLVEIGALGPPCAKEAIKSA